MVLPGTDGLFSKAQFPTSMVSELQRYLNPERGDRESFLIDLYTGMTCSEMGAEDQIRSPGRYGDACFGTRRLDGGWDFVVYFVWIFEITELPLFMISS